MNINTSLTWHRIIKDDVDYKFPFKCCANFVNLHLSQAEQLFREVSTLFLTFPLKFFYLECKHLKTGEFKHTDWDTCLKTHKEPNPELKWHDKNAVKHVTYSRLSTAAGEKQTSSSTTNYFLN